MDYLQAQIPIAAPTKAHDGGKKKSKLS